MTGHILLVTKLKGGAGATTLTRELAVAAATIDTVALIDLDGQGGTTRWWNRRNPPDPQDSLPDTVNPALLELSIDELPAKAAALRRKFAWTFIDSPPSIHEAIRRVAAVADLAIIPVRPTTDDLDAVAPIVRLIRGACDFGFVLTQVPGGGRSRDASEARELLAKSSAVFGSLSHRVDYPRASAIGRTAFESSASVSQSRTEVSELWETLLDRFKSTSSGAHVRPLSRVPGMPSSRDDAIKGDA
jgi:chromosome partitioning protein